MNVNLQVYLRILKSFTEGDITADEFESQYLVTFKGDETWRDPAVYEVLNALFANVDSYCADESIRGPKDLGPAELATAAMRAVVALEELVRKDAR